MGQKGKRHSKRLGMITVSFIDIATQSKTYSIITHNPAIGHKRRIILHTKRFIRSWTRKKRPFQQGCLIKKTLMRESWLDDCVAPWGMIACGQWRIPSTKQKPPSWTIGPNSSIVLLSSCTMDETVLWWQIMISMKNTKKNEKHDPKRKNEQKHKTTIRHNHMIRKTKSHTMRPSDANHYTKIQNNSKRKGIVK